MCEHRFFCRIQVSDLHRNRTIHVGRILESDIPIIPEFSQCVDIVFFIGYKYPTYVETNNPCRSDSRIRHSNHSRIFAMCKHRLFCRIPVSDLRRNRTIHVGRILESDIPIIPEFSQCVDIVFFIGYKYPTYVETNNPCRSDSRIRHSNHSRIFAMCKHRLFCRIPVSDLRRNRTIHVGRILESDISIIPEFSQCVDIDFFVGYKYPTTSLITATAGRLGMKQCVILCPHLYRIPILPILRYSGY